MKVHTRGRYVQTKEGPLVEDEKISALSLSACHTVFKLFPFIDIVGVPFVLNQDLMSTELALATLQKSTDIIICCFVLDSPHPQFRASFVLPIPICPLAWITNHLPELPTRKVIPIFTQPPYLAGLHA